MIQDESVNIIFDLDGTLIDSSERLYQLFQKLVPESEFSNEDYWNMKRNRINHKRILEIYFPLIKFENFNDKWMELIEKDEYLYLDKNYPDTIDVLDRLSSSYNIVLLTARQLKSGLYRELERLGIKSYFNKIFVTEGRNTKEELLAKILETGMLKKNREDLFVGDTGKDIIVGNHFGYRTVAITHGFMNRKNLQKYDPDVLINNLWELVEYILDRIY